VGQVAHLGKEIKVQRKIKMTATFSYIMQGAVELSLNIRETLKLEKTCKQTKIRKTGRSGRHQTGGVKEVDKHNKV